MEDWGRFTEVNFESRIEGRKQLAGQERRCDWGLGRHFQQVKLPVQKKRDKADQGVGEPTSCWVQKDAWSQWRSAWRGGQGAVQDSLGCRAMSVDNEGSSDQT